MASDRNVSDRKREEKARSIVRDIFRKYFQTEPAAFFVNYFKERIPEEERLGTLEVMAQALERLDKAGALPSRESLYSLIFDLINYSYGDWWFAIRDIPNPERKRELSEDSALIDSIASQVSLKFNILVRGVRQGKLKISSLSPYSPINTCLKSLLVFLINLNTPLAKNDPQQSLVEDLFDRVLRKAHGTLKMLSMGLGNDAYASWRTLHEAECILSLLVKDGEPLSRVYVQHIIYNNAFRGSIDDKEKVDEIFAQLKREMKERGLKSKDMKKYIEYGWLYSSSAYRRLERDSVLFGKYAVPVPAKEGEETLYRLGRGPAKGDPDYGEFQERKGVIADWGYDHLRDFKLNFRDGVENLAGLTRYSDWYETASEVTHSSAVFFYANDQFFFDLSTVALYQLSLRVTNMYVEFQRDKFESSPSTREMVDRLVQMCKRMSSDQAQRFQRLYGISVIDENTAPLITGLGGTDEGPRGVTDAGPILSEEEKKG